MANSGTGSSSRTYGWASEWFQRVFIPVRKPGTSSSSSSSSLPPPPPKRNSPKSKKNQQRSLTAGTLGGMMKDWMRAESIDVLLLGDVSSLPLLNIILWTTCKSEAHYQTMQNIVRSNPPSSSSSSSSTTKCIYPTKEFNPTPLLKVEEKTRQKLKAFARTKAFESFPFLLPEGNQKRVHWTIKHSLVPELHVQFKSEMELSPEQKIELGSLRAYWGKSVFCKGLGKCLQSDRIYIQQRIVQMIDGYQHLIRQMVVGMPCGVLEGNRTICDAGPDPLALRDRPCPDLVILRLNEDGLDKAHADYLLESGFVHRLILSDTRLILVYHCDEIGDISNASLKEHFMSCKNFFAGHLRQLLLREFLSQRSEMLTGQTAENQEMHDMEEKISAVLKNIDIIPVKPLLYGSLCLNRKEYADPVAFQKLFSSTNVFSLINTIANVKLIKCRSQLQRACDILIEKIDRNQPSSRSLFEDLFFRNFSLLVEDVVGACKEALLSGYDKLNAPLQQHEGSLRSSDGPTNSQQHSSSTATATATATSPLRPHSFSSLPSASFPPPSSSSSSQNSILSSSPLTISGSGSTESLIHSSPKALLEEYFEYVEVVWKSSVSEPVSAKLNGVILASHTITKDCVGQATSRSKSNLSLSERVRLRRVIEFCRMTHTQTLERVSKIQKMLTQDISKAIDLISLECVGNGSSFQLTSSFPPPMSYGGSSSPIFSSLVSSSPSSPPSHPLPSSSFMGSPSRQQQLSLLPPSSSPRDFSQQTNPNPSSSSFSSSLPSSPFSAAAFSSPLSSSNPSYTFEEMEVFFSSLSRVIFDRFSSIMVSCLEHLDWIEKNLFVSSRRIIQSLHLDHEELLLSHGIDTAASPIPSPARHPPSPAPQSQSPAMLTPNLGQKTKRGRSESDLHYGEDEDHIRNKKSNKKFKSDGSFPAFEKMKDPGTPVRHQQQGSSPIISSNGTTSFVPPQSINLSPADGAHFFNPLHSHRFLDEQNSSLMEQVSSSHLKLISCTLDANSQFRAISHLVFGSEEGHEAIRLLCMAEMARCPHLYESCIPAGSRPRPQEYIGQMLKTDTKGDYVSLMCAADALQAQIFIFSPAFEFPVAIRPRDPSCVVLTLCVYLNQNHQYFPLVAVEKEHEDADMMDFCLLSTPPRSGGDEEQTQGGGGGQCRFRKLSHQKAAVESIRNRFEQMELSSSDPTSSGSSTAATTTQDCGIVYSSALGGLAGMEAGKAVPLTLASLCITKIAQYAHRLPAGVGSLFPEELTHRILNCVQHQRNLTPFILHRILEGSGVEELDFSQFGSLSEESCHVISNLSRENLCSLKVSDTIPSEGGLQRLFSAPFERLREFGAPGCRLITNKTLGQIGSLCPDLEVIDLSGCQEVSDYGLVELCSRCHQLESLNLRNCPKVTGEFIPHLPSTLQELDVGNCAINCEKLGQMTALIGHSLRTLRVGGAFVSDEVVLGIAQNCSNLQVLELDGAVNVTQTSLGALSRQCRCLHSLKISQCDGLTEGAFEDPVAWTSLRSLEFRSCAGMVGPELEALAAASHSLTTLTLNCCDGMSTQSLCNFFLRMSQLQKISLSKCVPLNDSALIALSKSGLRLREIDVSCCPNISNEGMKILIQSSPDLEVLDISGCQLNDEILLETAAHCPNLRSLSCEETTISDHGLRSISQSCSLLQNLSMSHCSQISDNGLEYLCIGCPFMSKIDLSHCGNVTSRGIQQALLMWGNISELILRGFNNPITDPFKHPNLRSLVLSWNRYVVDGTLTSLAHSCPNLEFVDLAWCPNITARGVGSLVSGLQHLKMLNVRGSRVPSSRAVDGVGTLKVIR